MSHPKTNCPGVACNVVWYVLYCALPMQLLIVFLQKGHPHQCLAVQRSDEFAIIVIDDFFCPWISTNDPLFLD
eukprot:scaffold5515_cov70-Attheya_sp.AAC.1